MPAVAAGDLPGVDSELSIEQAQPGALALCRAGDQRLDLHLVRVDVGKRERQLRQRRINAPNELRRHRYDRDRG